MNLFNGLQETLFNTVTDVMGYEAKWLPSEEVEGYDASEFTQEDFEQNSSSTLTAKILYNGPTEKERLFAADYDPEKLTLEYKEGDFPGLYEAAENSQFEPILIDGVGLFFVASINKKFDGKTLVARLKKPD